MPADGLKYQEPCHVLPHVGFRAQMSDKVILTFNLPCYVCPEKPGFEQRLGPSLILLSVTGDPRLRARNVRPA